MKWPAYAKIGFATLLKAMKKLDDLVPITHIEDYMERFCGSEAIAIRHLKDNENHIHVWDLKALRNYETCRTELVQVREVEATLKFLEGQEENSGTYFNHFSVYLVSAKKPDAPEVKIQLEQDGQDLR